MSAPGGFIEAQGSLPRTKWTAGQIAAAVPSSRGVFTFPTPYNTRAWRITDATDGTGDYLWYVGYSYWRNMNYHVDDSVIKIFLGTKGTEGPLLFTLNKLTHAVTKVGPLFSVGHPLRSWNQGSAETWYWTHT